MRQLRVQFSTVVHSYPEVLLLPLKDMSRTIAYLHGLGADVQRVVTFLLQVFGLSIPDLQSTEACLQGLGVDVAIEVTGHPSRAELWTMTSAATIGQHYITTAARILLALCCPKCSNVRTVTHQNMLLRKVCCNFVLVSRMSTYSTDRTARATLLCLHICKFQRFPETAFSRVIGRQHCCFKGLFTDTSAVLSL